MKKNMLRLIAIIWSLGFSLAAEAVEFNIPPQSLDSALLAFSEQADVQLSVAAGGVAGIRTAGVKGELSAEEGLAALLQNTGLKFTAIGKRTYSVTQSELGAAGIAEDKQAAEQGMRLAETAQS